MFLVSVGNGNYLNKRVEKRDPKELAKARRQSFECSIEPRETYRISHDASKNYMYSLSPAFSGNLNVKPSCAVSFTSKNKIKIDDPVTAFGVSLLDKVMSNRNTDIKKEIRKFFKDNDMEDIEIRKLEKAAAKGERTVGGFEPNYSDDMGYNGGTLYLDDFNKKDVLSIVRAVGVITHELAHAYEHKKNNGLEMFREAGIKQSELTKLILGFTTSVSQQSTITHLIHYEPLQYVVNNFEKFGISNDEVLGLNFYITRYGTIFPKTGIKADKSAIYNAFGGRESFKNSVRSCFIQVASLFDQMEETKPYKNAQTHTLLQKYFIGRLRDEAIAYEKNSQINKHYQGISFDKTTLNDLIPMTYNMVADELENML